jgi:hypothetical protein
MIAWTLLAFFLLGLSAVAYSFGGTTLSGQLSAADHEIEEGYFSLGQDTTIMVKPGTELHGWLKNHVGERLRITVEPDADSD